MKKIMILFALACFANLAFAQNNFISQYYSDYEKDPSFSTINISEKTFSMFADIETEDIDEQRVLSAFAELTGVKVVNKEQVKNGTALYEDAEMTILNDERYEELARVNTQNGDFVFMIREEGSVVKEFTVITGSSEQFFMGTLYGDIDLKSISRLTKVIQKQGKDWFNVFENIDSEELIFDKAKARNKKNQQTNTTANEEMAITVFPNPVSDYVRLEAKDQTNESYEVQFFSSIGEPIKNLGKVNLPYEIQLADLPAGAYFVRLTNAEGAFKNYRIIKP
ncbi:MAG: DUF4252 domain-containing protein [Saprospiraceae bacterium]